MSLQALRARYFLTGTIISLIAGGEYFSSFLGIRKNPPLDDFILLGYFLIMTYAIVKYRLMDIKVAITRTGIFIAVYTLVLGFPFAIGIRFKLLLSVLLGTNWWFVPLAVMAILATTGPFVYIYIDRKAEEKLLKEQKRYQDTLKRASLGMTRIRDLQKLLKLIVYTVTKAVRIKYASIYIRDKENLFFNLGANRGSKNKTPLPQISINTPLIKLLIKEKEPIVLEEIKRQSENTANREFEEIKQQMAALGASVIVPSLVEDKLLGFMVLGDKVSGKIYSEDDLRVFTVLANQAALAIENARFFEEAKEMQVQISQADKMATIGTMADGLSHQINNRFHALSLIAGDTLDTLNTNTTNNYTPEQKDLFNQIQHGLNRILNNVSQGGEIVNGILKYTRKGEEGYSAVSLDNIIDSTLEMVQYKVKLSDIYLVKDYPQDTPLLSVNLTQMQEVFFNLIDNAYDSMLERKDILKEEGYQPKIRFSAQYSHEPGMLNIYVEDNGMGIKPEDLKKLFAPFFTTKTTSRKGTGLGLYVIKRIISANHNGTITLESNYKKGTTFTITLPIAAATKNKEERLVYV